MKKAQLITLAVCALATCNMAIAAQPTFKDRYNAAAKDIAPTLQTSKCESKPLGSVSGKVIAECPLQLGNSLLSLDSLNNRLTGAWLMLDSSRLSHPSDLTRSGAVLLRAARGESYGDYLAVASNVLSQSQRRKWQEACVDDKPAQVRFCVSSSDGNIFNFTLTPPQ